ncbi:MAG TPA: tetratricopeptide repeat protein, partial [bacterium]|nr:tetratricopeptide repeat protein [bacterium]
MRFRILLSVGICWLAGLVCAQHPPPASWEESFNDGVLLLAEGSFQKAQERFKEVLVVFPEHALTHYYLGKTYTALGDYEKALAAYKEALRLDSSLLEAYSGMGICLYQIGQYREALRMLTLADQLWMPDPGPVLFYSGLASYQLKNYHACKRFMERCRALDPDLEFVCRYYEGLAEANLGRYASARRELASLLKVHPQPVREAAADSLKALETQGKPFKFSLELGVEYDDNVILQPEGEPLPTEVSNQRDWRLVSQASFLYRRDFRVSELTISSSLYHCSHSRLSAYDLSGSSTSLLVSSNSKTFQPTLEYKYEYYLVGNEKYLGRHSLATSAMIASEYPFQSQFFLLLESTRFFQSSLVPGDERDSTAYLCGARFFIP